MLEYRQLVQEDPAGGGASGPRVVPQASSFAHEADVGVRGIGPTLESAFEQAAIALSGIVTDVAAIEPRETITITCAAPRPDLLLADWLNAVICRMAIDRMLFCRFRVRIANGQLHATACGEPVDRVRHAPAVEPKGATYTALKVEQRPEGGWIAQCVIDV